VANRLHCDLATVNIAPAIRVESRLRAVAVIVGVEEFGRRCRISFVERSSWKLSPQYFMRKRGARRPRTSAAAVDRRRAGDAVIVLFAASDGDGNDNASEVGRRNIVGKLPRMGTILIWFFNAQLLHRRGV
jgi:hypothetical protein